MKESKIGKGATMLFPRVFKTSEITRKATRKKKKGVSVGRTT